MYTKTLLASFIIVALAYAAPVSAQNVCYNANNLCASQLNIGQPCFCVKNINPVIVINGVCVGVKNCQATSFNTQSGGTGGIDKLFSQLAQQLGQTLMSKLLQGGSGGGSPASAPATGNVSGSTCTMTGTSDQAIVASNPSCYYYIAPTSASLTTSNIGTTDITASPISDALSKILTSNESANTGTNTSDSGTADAQTILSNTAEVSGQTDTNAASGTTQSTTVLSTTVQVPAAVVQANLTPGVSGDIKLDGSGGTIVAGTVDANAKTATAGFFGSNTYTGQQPAGIVAGLCQNRPWASGFLSYITPASFFDSLCSLRGYQVGTPAPVQSPTVTVTQSAPTSFSSDAAQTTPAASKKSAAPSTPLKVSIWASPATVSLGQRTSVFWKSEGADKCIESSPTGNFSQDSLSGGGSTAPITGTTVFTITCTALDGTKASDSVTVDIEI